MSKKDYSLALKFTAKTTAAAAAIRELHRDGQGRLRDARGRFVSMGREVNSIFSNSNSRIMRGVGRIASGFGGVASAAVRVGSVIGGAFVGGLKMAFGLVGKIAGMLRALPMAGLKMLAIGGAAVFAAHKTLSPAAEMERYRTQLDVMKKSRLYNFLTNASAGKPFQMGESVRAGTLMEAFKISSKKYLSTVMDASAAFKKPLEEIVRMLGYARSGRTGEAIESAGNIGITRGDLKKFGIKFEKSGAVSASTSGKLLQAMTGLMKSRFGGMATRIGTSTYEGAVSDLKDSFFRAVASAGKKFLPYGTSIVRRISGTVTAIGNKLAALPWDRWGQKLAAGVHAAGNIIDNLFDPKRRADIAKSIADGWNNVKGDIPKLGKALVLDLVDVASNASAPKVSKVFSSIFQTGGKLLGALITDPLITLWNVVHLGLVKIAEKISFLMADVFIWNKEKNAAKKAQIEKNTAKLLLKGLIKTNKEEVLEKWRRDMANLGSGKGTMSRTNAVMNSMRAKSGFDNIVAKLTASNAKKSKPIALPLLYPGRNTGYVDGKPVPLSPENIQSNDAIRTLARILPDMFSIKKETDVFGRDLKQATAGLQAGFDKNLDYQKDILFELRKLNRAIGGQ